MLARHPDGQVLQLNLARDEEDLEARQGKLDIQAVRETETRLETLRRIESTPAEGILREATENQASMIIMGWDAAQPAHGRIFDEALDDVIWRAGIPVITGQLERPIKSVDRMVLVIASNTAGVKLDDRSVGLARQIGDTFELPLLVLATPHRLENLTEQISRWSNQENYRLAALTDSDPCDEILENLGENDLLIVTTMGSQQRFSDSSQALPGRLVRETTGPLLVLHYP